ncbi:MAG: cobalamin B12-binding domain-containing protein [bacterium]|jgi:5-methyltetrahydrofolate--homocysteine methyltransferase
MENFKEIAKILYQGDSGQLESLIRDELDKGINAREILNKGLIKGMEEIGKDFKANILYMPEVLLSARAMNKCLAILKPYLAEGEVKPKGKIVIGTVEGDLHDIGKNLVAIMWEGAGFEVIDIGIDVPAHKFVQAVQEHKPDILGLSALLTLTLPGIRNVIEALEAAGIRDSVKVMAGGAPVTEKYAISAGADGYAEDAVTAVEEAERLLGLVAD